MSVANFTTPTPTASQVPSSGEELVEKISMRSWISFMAAIAR